MKRKVIEYLSRLLARFYRNQIVEVAPNTINKVNIGCGLSIAPGWLNLDGSLNAWIASLPSWTHRIGYKLSGANQFYPEDIYRKTLSEGRFIFHNINNGLPFRDQVIDFVFSSHFLEHLDKASGQKMLAECRRVLKPSGVLRIAVPDLEYAWQLYGKGQKELMLHDFFFTGTDTGFSQHRYAYDYELLEGALRQAGFDEIKRVSYREGATPDIDILDNRAEYTLFVEASYKGG